MKTSKKLLKDILAGDFAKNNSNLDREIILLLMRNQNKINTHLINLTKKFEALVNIVQKNRNNTSIIRIRSKKIPEVIDGVTFGKN